MLHREDVLSDNDSRIDPRISMNPKLQKGCDKIAEPDQSEDFVLPNTATSTANPAKLTKTVRSEIGDDGRNPGISMSDIVP